MSEHAINALTAGLEERNRDRVTSELGVFEGVGLVLNQLFLASVDGELGVLDEHVRRLDRALARRTELPPRHTTNRLIHNTSLYETDPREMLPGKC